MDALAGQPVVKPHGMGAGGEGLSEGQSRSVLVHMLVQCFTAGHAGALQRVRQVDALAVLVQPHEHRHVGCRGATEAELHAVDQTVQAVGGVQLAAEQAVAQAGPGGLALQFEAQPIFFGKALGGRDYHRGGIAQGHETDVQHALFRCIAAADPGQGVAARDMLFAHVTSFIHALGSEPPAEVCRTVRVAHKKGVVPITAVKGRVRRRRRCRSGLVRRRRGSLHVEKARHMPVRRVCTVG